MKAAWLVALAIACKSEQAPPPPGASAARGFGVVAEIRGTATLVAGTRRIALRAGTAWYESEAGALVDKPALGAAIAREEAALGGVVDVFLGSTPIVVGGEEHHEAHVRLTPAREDVALDGLATKIVTMRDGRELWAYTHELSKLVAVISGPTASPPAVFEQIGPPAESASPVSKRLCEAPHVQDLAVSDRAAYALVTECNDEAPLRLVTFDGGKPIETRLPSRKELVIAFELLAVSRGGTAYLVGVRDRRLAIDRLANGVESQTFDRVARVFAAVVADDDAVWTLVLDERGTSVVLRDGKRVELGDGRTATALGLDDKLGVVVLARGANAMWLLAERPGAPVVIVPR